MQPSVRQPSVARTILLVEDDAAIRESISECLAGEGYAVVEASHGAEALAHVDRGARPSLVLLDLVMPVMGGAQLVAELRGREALRGVPVVLMTAASGGGRERVPEVEAVLVKPFEVDDLIGTVARLTSRQ